MVEANRIQPASSTFPRNDPIRIRILNLDVIDRCIEVPLQAASTTAPSRPRSTRERDIDVGGSSGFGISRDSCLERASTAASVVKLSSENWRDFLQGIADNLYYQFSQSYRPAAQPSAQSSEDYLQYVVGVEEDSVDTSDRASVVGRKPAVGPGGRRMSRLGSVSSVRNLAVRHKK